MPKRKIKKSYRQVTGVLSSPKNERMIASESTLERDLYLLLDFDPLVESFEEQPETIPYKMRDGKLSRYTPDCLIKLVKHPQVYWKYSLFSLFFRFQSQDIIKSERQSFQKSGLSKPLLPKKNYSFVKSILVEVKYRQDLFESWEEIKPKLKAARAFSKDNNWDFRVITENEIRSQVLSNVKFIRLFRRHNFSTEEKMRVLNRLSELKSCKLKDFLNSFSNDLVKQGQILPIIWQLVGQHEITVDWGQPFTQNSYLGSIA